MKPQITVVSLGPGDPGLMTLQTADTLRHASRLVLRTAQHPVAGWLHQQHISFETLDSFYDQYEDFDEMHKAMASYVWHIAADTSVVFAVPDASADGAVAAIRTLEP